MSDKIDLTNNLCVSEDAFERFQSESLCEEDEFITLSDIVPQPQPRADLTACLDEIQDEDCIVSIPELQRNENIVSVSTTETNRQLDNSKIQAQSTVGNMTQDVSINTLQRTPKRGTRRKSTFISELQGSEDVTLAKPSVCNISPDASMKTAPHTPSKHTVRKTILLSELPNVNHGLSVSSIPQDVSKDTQQYTPSKTNIRRKSTIVSNMDISESTPSSTPIKGRMRRTSVLSHSEHSGDDDNQNTTLKKRSEHTNYNSVLDKTEPDILNAATSRQTRRRIIKRQSPDTNVNKQNNISGNATDNTKPRKRGRPKKIKTSTEENINTSIVKTNITAQPHATDKTQDDVNELIEKLPNQAPRRIRRTKSMASFNDNGKKEDSFNSVGDLKSLTDSGKRTSEQQSQKKKRRRSPKQNKSNSYSESNLDESSTNIRTKKNNLPEKTIDDKKYDEIERELIRILSTPTNIPEDDTDDKQTDNIQNVPKKRGRPKKPPAESSPEKHELQPKEKPEKSLHLIEQEGDDETDDICLSTLKKQLLPEDNFKEAHTLKVSSEKVKDNNFYETLESNTGEPLKTSDKNMATTCIDTAKSAESVEDNITESYDPENESPSKRPVRRKAKKVFHYDEGSDEDPFANVELSDDDLTGRKGRYYSDDEYIPGKRKKGKPSTESSMSESDEFENLEEVISKKQILRKKSKKSDDSLTTYPSKRSKKLDRDIIPDVTSTAADTTTQNEDDFDVSLQSPDISTNDSLNQTLQAWNISNEFENFIAKKIQGSNIQIKKVSGTTPQQAAITPLEIPVLDPNEPKTVEMFTQTNVVSTKTVEVQTTCPYESKMKTKVALTAEQSEKACEFLKGVVRTTSDLGQLMIQKSEDFIQKKINTRNVTDTTKMDYCVQKSFLLFKLAKHNLIQMEEDLANEYERFLRANNMLQYQESPKCITATPKPVSSDSDCEIVEEPAPTKTKEKSNFNLKTVFLNKELSIKIAKKSTEEPQISKEKLNIKGRHTVWINDSIMVKKVKPTQSFLAQDSRNKKPPDTYITEEMVKHFFDNYYKRLQISACAPFVSPEWLNVKQICVCNYFIAKSNDISTARSPVLFIPQPISTNSVVNGIVKHQILQPMSLQTLCTKALQKFMYVQDNLKEYSCKKHTKQLLCEQKHQPESLLRLSLFVMSNTLANNHQRQVTEKTQPQGCQQLRITRAVNNLKVLCLDTINKFISHLSYVDEDALQNNLKERAVETYPTLNKQKNKNIKTLFSLCVELIQCIQLSKVNCVDLDLSKDSMSSNTIKPLKYIAFESVRHAMYKDFNSKDKENVDVFGKRAERASGACTETCSEDEYLGKKIDETLVLTIESVNTLSDDIFSKLPDSHHDTSPTLQNDESNYSDYDNYEPDCEEDIHHNNSTEDSNWVSKVQLQELKSCFIPVDNKRPKTPLTSFDSNMDCITAQIKIEPLEEIAENVENPLIKNEPVDNYDDMTSFTPLITKVENPERLIDTEDINRQNSTSYDEDAFETFARTNKMFTEATDYNLANDEIFSQSASRVRRQYEPDMDDDFDTEMSLLIPQQHMELAKDRLMASSSDEGTDVRKNMSKKKRKTRPKIPRHKNKDTSSNKDKNTGENAVALLTKKMQDRIRQAEKKDESSDSELENSLALRLENSKRALSDKDKLKKNIEIDNQIQCNDVDSTENINDNVNNYDTDKSKENKVSNKSLVEKRKRSNLQAITDSIEEDAFVMQLDNPVELLECEPILPMMHDSMDNEMDNEDQKSPAPDADEELPYTERYGWKCFPVNNNDTKLYQHTYIMLEKLPESFVETYFKYQSMTSKNEEDTDIDRLTNLNSLYRNTSKETNKLKKTSRVLQNGQLKSKDESLSAPGSLNDDNCNEFSPSEDEGANIDDEVAPPAPRQDATDNALAKNSLMNDPDSDSEKPANTDDIDKPKKTIKKEVEEEGNTIRTRSGPKSKCKGIKEIDSLMLTADKMMNKELTMLHAPVSLDGPDADVNGTPKKSNKTPSKSAAKQQAHLERAKLEEDSSSEEEKQWVTTKEKLLKRLERKQENPIVDDAKRAKIVSEFIERRGDAPEYRPRGRTRNRRSSKKFLERQKQMSVLKRELFGESDASHKGKTHSQAFGKGRKNIRKVIDKKSLARSTVVANMEEFERKRRLNMQQTRLREHLGCEEGVNVLVINDEVCLEYDFEQMQPVVTVHPFFTKVMKAHQYEGVKFMWDACFESLSLMESGHPGSGCILAHCMGLGKTLQVLALLHTVLTHPRVGMQRVLVCCPLSTVLNWVDEIHKWIGPVTNKIKVFEMSKLKKTYERAYQLEDWYNGGGIFIIGYELFRSLTTLDPVLDDIRPTIVNKIRNALLDPGPDVVICDEGHLLKNDSSVLAVAMSRVATRRRIVLTGTPMQNNLREYYCMVNFVKPSLLGTYAEYSNRFENPIMNGQHRDSREEDIKLMKTRTHILHKVLEGCLQRQEASVLYPYLPKKHEYTVFIPPTKCQWDLYKHYIMTYAMQQQQKQKQSMLKDFHVLQKIWTHPQVLHNFLMKDRDERNKIKVEKLEDDLAQEDLAASEDVKPNQTEVWWLQYLEGGGMLDSLESSNKFLVVFQLLEECIALGDKILIFSTSLYTMDALEYFLKRINKWSLGQEYYRLDGSVPAEVRQKWCREFNAEHNVNTKLFLISTRAGSLGLNMTAANRVIILDTSWNPAHDIQSIFRVYRFGQKKDCYIYRLVAMGTMEQKIYERAVTKQAVACRVVDEQQIDRHYNMAELTELYRFDEEGTSVEAGLAAGVADVALLRVAARARLHAVREHDSLLRGTREQHLPEHERDAAWVQFQEEHANTHHLSEMQNRLMEASQGIQRLLETDMAMPSGSVEIKTEIGEEQYSKPAPVLKGKKGKKKITIIYPPPLPEPNASQQTRLILDAEKEKAKVKKITDLLIKYEFHTSKHAQEITQLVANVRRIVDAGGVGLDDCDELTRSIATVMMQEEEDPKVETETTQFNTDAISRDLNTCENKPVGPEESLLVKESNIQKPLGRSKKRRIGRPSKPSILNSELCVKNVDNESVSLLRKRLEKSSNLKYNVPERIASKESSPEVTIEPVKEVGKKQNLKYGSEINLIDDDEDDDTTFRDDSVSEIDFSEETNEIQRENPSRIVKKTYQKKSAPKTPPEIETSVRTRRKAALAAEQHLEQLEGDCIVTLDDDDDEWIDYKQKGYTPIGKVAPAIDTPTDNSKTSANTESTSKKDDKRSAKTSKRQADTDDESILLSDDEDLSSKRVNNEPVNVNQPEELIPLHPSLLSNPNFIKIVAYAYQSNRMLDEGAAMLAAQYSTQKALKEIETTGKDITSGPIYDIAVKVLGYDILKKLHSKSKTKTKKKYVIVPSAPVNDTEEIAQDSCKTQQKTTKRKTDKAHKESPRLEITETIVDSILPIPVEYNDSEIEIVPASTSRPSNVVPVGMFKGSVSMSRATTQMVEECILPDDDEPTLQTSNENTRIYKKPNAQPLIITSVSSKGPAQRKLQEDAMPELISSDLPPPLIPLPPKGYLTISEGKLVMPYQNTRTKANSVAPVQRQTKSSVNDDTICLDSDEEDVTVIRQAVNTSKVNKSQMPLLSTVQGIPLVMRVNETQATGDTPETQLPKSQPNYIVVPAAQDKLGQRKNGTVSANPNQQPSSSNANVNQQEPPQPTVKKVCKPGDIVRITKKGDLEVLTRLEKLPNNIKPTNTAVQPLPLPDASVIKHKAKQAISEKLMLPTSGHATKSTSVNDPLSILKDVVHIQAGEYEKPAIKSSSKFEEMKPDRKSSNNPPTTLLKVNKEMVKINSAGNAAMKIPQLKESSDKTPYSLAAKIKPANASSQQTKYVIKKPMTQVTQKPSDKSPKPTDKHQTPTERKPKPTTSIVVGTSKDIILRTKSGRGPVLKTSTVANNVRLDNTKHNISKPSVSKPPDIKKRVSPWPDDKTAKKKKSEYLRPAMTLKDFNLDDIDDIIELE